METVTRRFKWSWIGSIVGSSGLATGVVVYRQTTVTFLILVVAVAAILIVGGLAMGMRLHRGDAVPSAAGRGTLALGLTVTIVGAFQATAANCRGDCEQGGGLRLIAIVAMSFVAFAVTMSCGKLVSRRRTANTRQTLRSRA